MPEPTSESTQPNAFERHFRSGRQEGPQAQSRRPWLLSALALICAALVVVGSFGPWMYYERVSDAVPETSTTYGTDTDGMFSILFAVVAILALLVALLKADAEDAAWFTVGAMTLCAVIGLFDWLVIAPTERSLEPGELGEIARVEWGVKLVGIAGAAGALISSVVARQMNRY